MPANDSLQSIQRAVQVLYAVAGVESGCTIREIAAKIGLKPNTAYRFIRTLEEEHLLLRKTKPLRFVLGHTLTELKTLDDERHLLSMAGKILIRTQAKLPVATISLMELYGGTNYQRLSVQSNRPGVLIQRREFIVPLYEKASSLLFLAYCHPDEAHKFYTAQPFETKGKPIWKNRQKLEDFLARVRRLGYSQPEIPDSDGPHYRVAAPVFSKGQELIAAIGGFIYADEPKTYRLQLIGLCRKAAADLTAQLQKPQTLG